MDEKSPAPPPPEAPPPAPPPKKKKSWLKRLAIGGGISAVALTGLALFVVPPVASSIATGKIKELFRKQLNGEIDIGSLSLSILSGTASLTDVRVTPNGGDPLFTLPQATAKIGVFGAIGGHYDIQLDARDAFVNLVREADGKTNLDVLMASRPQEPPPAAPDKPASGSSEPMDLKFTLQITSSRLLLRDKKTGKETEIKNLDIKADVPSLQKDADVKVSFQVVNGGEGKLDARINPTTLAGTVTYLIDLNALKSLEAAAGIFAPLDKLEGSLKAEGKYTILKFPTLNGAQTLTIKGLKLGGPLVGAEPVEIPEATLTQTTELDEQGNGKAQIRLVSGKGIDLTVNADLKGITGADSTIGGTLTFASNLAELTRQMAGVLKLKPGYRLQGNLTARSTFSATLKDKKPVAATLDLATSGTDLVVVDSAGRANPMNTELVLNAKADYNKAAGTLNVPSLVARFGDLRMDGNLDVSGLQDGGTIALKDSKFDLHADLDKLTEKLADFIDLKQRAKGAVDLTVIVAGQGKTNQVTLSGAFKNVLVTGLTHKNEKTGADEIVTAGPLDGTLKGKISVDMNPGAASKIEEFKLQTNVLAVSASGTIFDAANPESMKFDLGTATRLVPSEAYNVAGQFLSQKLSGQPVDVWINVAGSMDSLTATFRAVVTSLTVELPPKEGKPATRFAIQNLELKSGLTRKGDDVSWTLTGPSLSGKANGKLATKPDLFIDVAYQFDIEKLEEFTKCAGGVVETILPDRELRGDLHVSGKYSQGTVTRLKGALTSKHMEAVAKAPAGPLQQDNLELTYDITMDSKADKIAIDEMAFKSDTATSTTKGRMIGKEDLDLTMSFTSDLARVKKDLGGFLNPDIDLKGQLNSSGRITTENGVMKIVDNTAIANFHMAGKDKAAVDEPEVRFDARATMDAKGKILDFQEGKLTSGFLHGTMKGRVLHYDDLKRMELRGMAVDFAYIPEKLNTVLSPWLGEKTKLVGKEERKITGTLDGKAVGEGNLALLRGSTGNFDMSVGRVEAQGFKMDAALKSEVKDQNVRFEGPAEVNGGKMSLTGGMSLKENNPSSTFALKANNVNLNADNGNVLAMVSGMTEKAGDIQGTLSSDITGQYVGDLADLAYLSTPTKEITDPEILARQKRARQGFKMQGSMNIDKFVCNGSSFVTQMVSWMDLGEANVPGYLKLSEFDIKDGFTSIRKMEMRIQHTVVNLWGTISMDKQLNLTMRAPMDAKMLRRIGFDKDSRELIGQTIDIPIRGTTDKPDVDFAGAVGKVTSEYLKKLAEKEAKKAIEDLLKPKKKK